MSFLKENLFLVVTLLVLLVAGGGVVAWMNSQSALADERSKVRSDLARNIVSEAADPVNAAVVGRAERKVARLRGERARVARNFLVRSTAYRPMQFTATDTRDKPVNAFPITVDLYDKKGMRALFPNRYRKDLDAIFARLKATRPPTTEEITKELERLRAKGVNDTRPIGGRAPMDMGREMFPGDGGPMGPRQPGATAPAPLTPEQQKTATEQATDTLVVQQADTGEVYAKRTDFDERLPADIEYREELWPAQVTLWVHSDIVDAIKTTNDSYRRRVTTGKLRGVQSSAIKRLHTIRMLGYACNGQARGGGMPMGPGGGGDFGGGGPEMGPGGRPVVGAPIGGGGSAAGQTVTSFKYIGGSSAGAGGVGPAMGGGGPAAVQTAGSPKLTGRVTNQLYDVIHYQFTVDVTGPALLRLYDNLLSQNYHTILDVSIGKVDRTGSLAAAAGHAGMPGMGAQGGTVLFEYGSAPVLRATITGELLILADWTRGKWDTEKDAWDPDYPTLMPVEFLKMLQSVDSGCLRPKDLERINKQ